MLLTVKLLLVLLTPTISNLLQDEDKLHSKEAYCHKLSQNICVSNTLTALATENPVSTNLTFLCAAAPPGHGGPMAAGSDTNLYLSPSKPISVFKKLLWLADI